MKNNFKIFSVAICVTICFLITACGVIDINGKTFVFENVSIDWGRAQDENKQEIYEDYLVSGEQELLNVLRTKDAKNEMAIVFGTDYKYTFVNGKNEIQRTGYYKQNDDIILFSDSPDSFNEPGLESWHANDKGIVESFKINDTLGIFARYQYVVKN